MAIIVWIAAGLLFTCSLVTMIMIGCDYRDRHRMRVGDNYRDLEDNE